MATTERMYGKDGKLTQAGALRAVREGRTVLTPRKVEADGGLIETKVVELRSREAVLHDERFALMAADPVAALGEVEQRMADLQKIKDGLQQKVDATKPKGTDEGAEGAAGAGRKRNG